MAGVTSEYIVLGSKIETGRPGEADICTRIEGMDISDEELLKVKEVQRSAVQDMENILNKKQLSETGKASTKQKKKVLTYKDGRPGFEEKEL